MFKKIKNKKGQSVNAAIFTLIFLSIGLVVTGVVISFGANFVQTQQNTLTSGTTAYNATVQSLTALNSVAAGQGTVTTVAILAIVVGLLLGVVALFSYLRGNQGNGV